MEGVKIGLEIHVQLNTQTKLFCPCSADWAASEPNHNICPVCTAQVGSKPFGVNKRAVIQALKIAYLLRADVEPRFYFNRKHYFYPDLPSNYQRTSIPIAKNGILEGVRFWEMHVEEDPGRYDLKNGPVDYNRAGVPLIEIVTAPEIKSPEHADVFLLKLRRYLMYANAMRKGDGVVRVDVNVSIPGGARVEIKNVNSFSNVVRAIKSEIKRQKNLVDQGYEVEQETRHFDENSGVTFRLRRKETADDYRYVLDPDLLPVEVERSWIEEAEKEVGPHPEDRLAALSQKCGVDAEELERIMSEKELVDTFEYLIVHGSDPHRALYFLLTWVKKQINYRNLLFRESGLRADQLSTLCNYYGEGKITDDVVETVLIKMLDDGIPDVDAYIKENDLFVVHDEDVVKTVISNVIKKYGKAVEDYKKGEHKALYFLVGKVMEQTKGTVDPHQVADVMKRMIEE